MSKRLFYNYCSVCDKDNQPFEYRRDVLCLWCSVEINDHHIARDTNLKGNLRRKKLLQRRYHLRELLGTHKVKRSETLERENVICRGCGNNFIAVKIDKLLYCGDCTKFRNMMEDIRLKNTNA